MTWWSGCTKSSQQKRPISSLAQFCDMPHSSANLWCRIILMPVHNQFSHEFIFMQWCLKLASLNRSRNNGRMKTPTPITRWRVTIPILVTLSDWTVINHMEAKSVGKRERKKIQVKKQPRNIQASNAEQVLMNPGRDFTGAVHTEKSQFSDDWSILVDASTETVTTTYTKNEQRQQQKEVDGHTKRRIPWDPRARTAARTSQTWLRVCFCSATSWKD